MADAAGLAHRHGIKQGTRNSADKTGKTISTRNIHNSGYVWEGENGIGE